MNPQEARKLLGGYAAGILTPEEERALFAAALEDQELFNTLMGEQALRETLSAPGAKEQLLAAMERPAPRRRWWLVPAAIMLPAAAASVMVGIALWRSGAKVPTKPTALVAEMRTSEAPVPLSVSPAAPPAEETKPKAKNFERQPVVPPRSAAAAGPRRVRSMALGEENDAAAKAKAAPAVVVDRPAAKDVVVTEAAAAPVAPAAMPAPAAPKVRTVASAGNAFQESGKTLVPAAQSPALMRAANLMQVAARTLEVSVLQLQPDGSYSPANALRLRPGDAVKLRITPAADGLLTVTENPQTDAVQLAKSAVEKGKPFEVDLVSDKPESRTLKLEFVPAAAGPPVPPRTVMLVFR